MTEEEKEAVKYTENCLMKITMGIDCEFDVNILDALINIIKKLQKENEELKKDYYNLINKIENKIDRFDYEFEKAKKQNDKDKSDYYWDLIRNFKKMLESEE